MQLQDDLLWRPITAGFGQIGEMQPLVGIPLELAGADRRGTGSHQRVRELMKDVVFDGDLVRAVGEPVDLSFQRITSTKDAHGTRQRYLGIPFDAVSQDEVISLLKARTPSSSFGFVATPNVQHVVQCERDAEVVANFDAAWLSVCDSRPLRALGWLSGRELPLVTGSDLTAVLFRDVIESGDRISVICASERLGDALRRHRPDIEWDVMIPPMGCKPGTAAFAGCVDFIANSHARFIFVCLGAPKSEAMCAAACKRPGIMGTALCTGAALEFMLGLKRRAPKVLQVLALEWLHRMLSEPRRLFGRYLFAVLPLARLWIRETLRDVAQREQTTALPTEYPRSIG